MNQPPTDTGNANRFPNLAHIFRILQFFKKRAFYRSFENVKPYHMKIIDDLSCNILEEDKGTGRNFRSIWRQKTQLKIKESKAFRGITSAFSKIISSALRLPVFQGKK
jgi:hypothetical protein